MEGVDLVGVAPWVGIGVEDQRVVTRARQSQRGVKIAPDAGAPDLHIKRIVQRPESAGNRRTLATEIQLLAIRAGQLVNDGGIGGEITSKISVQRDQRLRARVD